jgi:3-isopropylmalate/(R)-2-methylmalate dehydratase small subunit
MVTKKHNLMNGFDDIDYLQAMKGEIKEFEAERIF